MVDQNSKNPLDSEPFSFREYKNGNISIFWNGKEVTILKGKNAQKFSLQIENATEIEAQLIMAKITGNFKRGNERQAKYSTKN
jgi:hypothetical protein